VVLVVSATPLKALSKWVEGKDKGEHAALLKTQGDLVQLRDADSGDAPPRAFD
jgi:hypothetical protein